MVDKITTKIENQQSQSHIVYPAVREDAVLLSDCGVHAAVACDVCLAPHGEQMELKIHLLLLRSLPFYGLQLFLYEGDNLSILGQRGQVSALQGIGRQVVQAESGRETGLLVLWV
jgi:hypothetical protein